MKKIIAGCATLALFAQFTEAKVAAKPTQDKQKLEKVDVNECECEKDPFAGPYLSASLGYGSTKTKLVSDLTVIAHVEGNAAAIVQNTAQAALDESNKDKVFDTATVKVGDPNTNATITAEKHTKRSKTNHNMTGGVGFGWLWKVSSAAYFGVEGSLAFDPDSTTSLQFLNNGNPKELHHIDLKRGGVGLGIGGLLGWNVGQSNLIYGKVGLRSASVEVRPSKAGAYTKKSYNPEFGLGFKRLCPTGVALGLEATYTLNKKINMNDVGKDHTFVDFTGTADVEPALKALNINTPADPTVNDGDSTAVVKSKRTGTWKVQLTISVPIK